MGKQLHLNLMVRHDGFQTAAWRHELGVPDQPNEIERTIWIAQEGERGLMDSIFLGDGVALSSNPWQYFTAPLEPMTLLSALAVATKHIGLIGSITTTYSQPYNAARQLAALDHISHGRAGWNIVTTQVEAAAANFGDSYPDHTTRYLRAAEYTEAVMRLWDSWMDDAIVGDKESGIFVDPEKVRPIDFHGEFIHVRGPLNISRPPQGHPLIVQAGSSEEGMELAARVAEAVFTSQNTVEEGREFYTSLKNRMKKFGRKADELSILPGLAFTLGSTEEEANKLNDELAELVDPAMPLANLSRRLEIDLSQYPYDGPVPLGDLKPPEEMEQGRSRYELIINLARRENMTIRDLVKWQVGSGVNHRSFVGTPEGLADDIELWVTTGASDGFSLMPGLTSHDLPIFVDEVVPLLQKRGLYRTEYPDTTLRGLFGHPPVAEPLF